MVKQSERRIVRDGSEENDSPAFEAMPIWEKIAALGKSIPEEEWGDVPTDGSKNYKHYLYGTVKRAE